MLSKEFLNEAGQQINPATGDPYTPAERDAEYAKNQAQGQKNLQGIKDFGSKVGQGIQNFFNPGTGPAQTQYQADANKARVKAALPGNMSMDDFNKARDASEPEEPPTPISATADAKSDIQPPATPAVQVGVPNPRPAIQATPLPAPVKSFAEPAPAAPAAGAGGYGSGMNNPSVAPKATDPAAQYAAADAGRAAIKSSETNPELERMKTNAGLKPSDVNTGGAGGVGGGGQAAAPFAGQTDEFGGMESPPADDLAKIKANAGLAAAPEHNPEAELDSTILKTRQDQDAAARKAAEAPAQAAEPAPAPVKAFVQPEAPAAPAAPTAPTAPTAPVDADTRRPGQLNPADAAKYQPAGSPAAKPAAKSDPAVLKQQQDLIAKGAKIKADGIMGPATQAAIKQFAAAPAASRSTAPAAPSAGGGRGFVNPTAPAPAAAKPAAPAAPAKPAVRESQEINRMRFLAGLTKD